jgi:hypothetical protein
MGVIVLKSDKIDNAKLLGFDAVSDQIADGVDFQDEAIGAKLGAKVGNEAGVDCELRTGLADDSAKVE